MSHEARFGSPATPPHVATAEFAYRPEVDGLRAVAVIPVVLFHAGLPWVSGGYVGVDVFFVISGYLITSIVLSERIAGRFSIGAFYERRARRILPALFLVLAASAVCGWFWMTPHHLKGYAQSMVAASLFVPNVYFFLKSGYFDLDSDEKPLLHTWSLGVEEQYYFGFPLFLVVVWRYGARVTTWLVAGIAAVSFGLSEWVSRVSPDANFYLAPTRAWELAFGSLLAIAPVRGWSCAGMRPEHRETLAAGGLLLIGAAIFLFDRNTRFPGATALVPTLGAVLVIAFADRATWVGRLLSWRPIVLVGLISYSLYLWHQPVFAIARLRSTERPTPLTMTSLVVLSVVLAFVTWRYVEGPARNRRLFTRREVFAAATVGSAVFALIGLAGHFGDGFPARLPVEVREILAFGERPEHRRSGFPGPDCFLVPGGTGRHFGECVDNAAAAGGTVVLWGDSHAAHLYPGLTGQIPRDRRLVVLTSSACPPLPQPSRSSNIACQSVNEYVLARIARERPQRVIVAGVWGNYEWSGIAATLRALRDAGAGEVVVIGPLPRWHPSLPVVLSRFGVRLTATPTRTGVGLDASIPVLDRRMREVVSREGGIYLSAFDALCDAAGCLTRTGDDLNAIIQWDVSHLTPSGSDYLVSVLLRHW